MRTHNPRIHQLPLFSTWLLLLTLMFLSLKLKVIFFWVEHNRKKFTFFDHPSISRCRKWLSIFWVGPETISYQLSFHSENSSYKENLRFISDAVINISHHKNCFLFQAIPIPLEDEISMEMDHKDHINCPKFGKNN